MSEIELKIKELIVSALELEDIRPADISSDAPLFDGGLGLDSIDALELGLALHRAFGVRLDAEDETTREHFRSVSSLAKFVAAGKAPEQRHTK
jgi:acyl carrier protein